MNKPLLALVKDGRRSRRAADQKTLAGRVQSLRESRGWSQQDLADTAKCSQPTVANIELGRTKGGYSVTISKIAKALNVNEDWLRTGKGDPTRRLTGADDEAEVAAIYGALSATNRVAWLAAGRAFINSQKEGDK